MIGGREMTGIQVDLRHVLAVQEEHVVVQIHADSAESADHPAVREGLRPGAVDFILQHDALRPQRVRRRRGYRAHHGSDQKAISHWMLSGRSIVGDRGQESDRHGSVPAG